MKKDKFKRLKDIVFALTHPAYWLSNDRSSSFIDALISEIIEKDLVVRLEHYKAITKGGSSIWVANYPYAYGSMGLEGDLLPYRRTRRRLRNYLLKKSIENEWLAHDTK